MGFDNTSSEQSQNWIWRSKFDNISWDGPISSLQNGNHDAIIAGITITPGTAHRLPSQNPTLSLSSPLVVHANWGHDITDLASLKGKNVAAQISTTGDYAAEEIEGLGTSRYNT